MDIELFYDIMFHVINFSLVMGFFIVYFFPSFFAIDRKYGWAIFMFNFFVGWTMIGWFITFILAIMAPHKEPWCSCGKKH